MNLQPTGAAPRLRVAFCIDNMNVGGTELNAVRTAELLREHVELRVVTLQTEGPLFERYRRLGIPVHTLPIPRLYGIEALRQGRRLRRLLRKHRIDIVHAHDIYSNIFAAPWARAAGCAFVASRRWWEGGPRRLMRWANRTSYRFAHVVLANAPSVASLIQSEGVAPARIRVVPNFLDRASLEPPEPAWIAENRQELRIPDGVRVVVSVASLSPVKDHATLLRAFASLPAEHVQAVLLLVGADAGSRAQLERLASSLGIDDRVRFAGFRPNRPNPHFLGDVSVLSSVSEGLPNSLLEAMAAGRPVVATRVGAVPDIIHDGENGYLVPPGDAAAMADRLARLLRDPELRRRFGGQGLRRAEAEFSPQAALNALLGAYRYASAPR